MTPNHGSLGDLLAVFLRRWRTMVAVPILLGVLTVAWTFLRPRTWSSTVVFMPERSDLGRLGNLAGLASQFGVQLPFGETGLTPLFYAELLHSRQLLGELAESPVAGASGEPRPLMDHLRVTASSPELRREKAADRLKRLVGVKPDETVGLVHVRVVMPSAALAKGAADRLIELVNRFNVERRRTRARAEREFAEARERAALEELREAEGRLLAFVTQNRDVAGSPALLAQRDRMSREVTVRQSLYTSVRQAYEQARLEEVRDTPTITVVEDALLPARPDSRKLVQKLALALAVGALVSALVVLWSERRAGLAAVAGGRPGDRAA